MLTYIQKNLIALCAAACLAGGACAAQVKTLAIMTAEEGTDFGWNQQGIDAAQAAAQADGLELIVAAGLGYGNTRPTLRELAADGANLILAHASGYATAATEIAEETKVPVAIVDSPDALKAGLIGDYTVSGHEGAYLAGRLAAKMSQSKHVGIVVSSEPPMWNSHSAAFAQGVQAENTAVKITYAVIGPAAYSDAAGARRVTESVIAAGADIIFGQGNGSSFGMLQAVETSGGKALFIDVIGDKSSIAPQALLTSVLWDMTPVFSAMIADLKADTFGTKRYAIGLADDSVRLIKTAQIPEAIWQDIQHIRSQIIAGEITLKPVFDAPGVRRLMTDVSAAPN